jgi:hypothetical protein
LLALNKMCGLVCLHAAAGTVFVKDTTVHLSENVRGFRSRSSRPKAGEAAFVLQVPAGLLADNGGASWTLTDEAGTAVQLE